VEELLNAGADEFVKKPFSIETLLKQIDELLELA